VFELAGYLVKTDDYFEDLIITVGAGEQKKCVM
jgi:hypothetical protein